MRTVPLDAVLFDLDGTLVRTFINFPALRLAVVERARSRFNAPDAVLAMPDSLDIVAATLAALPARERGAARSDLYRVLKEHERRGCGRPEAIPGATHLLTRLADAGIRVAVVTRNAREIAVSLCDDMGLRPDALIGREDTETYKPHPEPVLVACKQLNVIPARAVVVGDLWADVASGKAAGCAFTIGIQWAYDPPDRFADSEPTHVVGSLLEAGDILRRHVPAETT